MPQVSLRPLELYCSQEIRGLLKTLRTSWGYPPRHTQAHSVTPLSKQSHLYQLVTLLPSSFGFPSNSGHPFPVSGLQAPKGHSLHLEYHAKSLPLLFYYRPSYLKAWPLDGLSKYQWFLYFSNSNVVSLAANFSILCLLSLSSLFTSLVMKKTVAAISSFILNGSAQGALAVG